MDVRGKSEGGRVLEERQNHVDEDDESQQPAHIPVVVDAVDAQGGGVDAVVDGVVVDAVFDEHRTLQNGLVR